MMDRSLILSDLLRYRIPSRIVSPEIRRHGDLSTGSRELPPRDTGFLYL